VLVDSVPQSQLTKIEKKIQLELRQFVWQAGNVGWVKLAHTEGRMTKRGCDFMHE
jgi:hypothetical protein